MQTIIKQIIEIKDKKLKEALRGFELVEKENFQLEKSKTFIVKKKKKGKNDEQNCCSN